MHPLKIPSLPWRRTTDSWLPRHSTEQQPSSGSQCAPDIRMRASSEGCARIDATSHGNGQDVIVTSPVSTTSPLPDVSVPPNILDVNKAPKYDITKGVWDLWARMPKDVRRWERPARYTDRSRPCLALITSIQHANGTCSDSRRTIGHHGPTPILT